MDEIADNNLNQENQPPFRYRTKLEKVMKEKGLLQKQLAERANVQVYQISELCSGKSTNIMLDTAKRICRVLKCTLDKAFGDEAPPK